MCFRFYKNLALVIFILVGCSGNDLTPQATQGNRFNSIGRMLPEDAASPDNQKFRYMFREPSTLDISVAAYEADGTYFAFERLLLLDENNEGGNVNRGGIYKSIDA